MESGSRRSYAAALAAITVLMAGALVCEFLVWPDWDAAWLLTIARRIRSGATLYSNDLIEVNPPMIVDVARLVLAGSDSLGIRAITAWRLCVFALEAVSLVGSLRLLGRLVDAPRDRFLAPAAVAATAALACLPGIDFGQREHFILLLSAPYVLAAAVYVDGGQAGRGWRIAAGAMMAVALSIKPHYALLVLCVEAGVVMHTRRARAVVRVETVSAVAFAIAVAAALVWRYPGYLTVALPFALRYYRDYVGLQLAAAHGMYLGLAALAVVAARRMGVRTSAPALLWSAGFGAYLALVAQGKGWGYHFVPARSLLFLSGGLATVLIGRALVSRLARHTTLSPARLVSVATIAVVAVLGGLMIRRTVNINNGPWPRQFAELTQLLQRERPAGTPLSMATLSLELFPAFPVVELLGGEWASRYSCLWTVPAIEAHERAQNDRGADGTSERARLIAEIGEDLTNRRPTVVLVEESRSSVLDAVVAAGPVRDALRSYRLAGHVGKLGVWLADRP